MMSALSDAELNRRVAEALGWTNIIEGSFGVRGIVPPALGFHLEHVPSYATDLNACAEFEKTLTPEQWNEYSRHLEAITRHSGDHLPFHWQKLNPSRVIDVLLIHATARQRCEAFLKVVAKDPK